MKIILSNIDYLLFYFINKKKNSPIYTILFAMFQTKIIILVRIYTKNLYENVLLQPTVHTHFQIKVASSTCPFEHFHPISNQFFHLFLEINVKKRNIDRPPPPPSSLFPLRYKKTRREGGRM